MSDPHFTKVRYQLANLDEGFVVARTSRAACQALNRILARQKAMGHRVRRRTRADGRPEYLVTSGLDELVARYWLDTGSRASSKSSSRRSTRQR